MSAPLDRPDLWKAAEIVAARTDLHAFMGLTTPDYVDGWCVRDVCANLHHFSAQVAARKSPRVLISLPPRTGKTLHCCERFPAWHLGQHPTHRAIVASYSLSLARDATRAAREVAQSLAYRAIFPRSQLAPDTRAKADWRTKADGGMKATGVGGALTGFGADILIIDDPHKNAREALSQQRRDDVWAWYQAVARTRVQPGGGILGIMTRWHEDDLVGRLLTHAKHEGWVVINYAAIAGEDEYFADGRLRRRKGASLQPRRYDRRALEDIRKTIGEFWWSALYTGRPTAPSGHTWPRHTFRFWTQGPPTPEQASLGWLQKPERFERFIISADLTFGSQSGDASWVDLLVHGLSQGRLYLLEEERFRAPYPVQRARLEALARKYPGARILVEKAAHGAAILQELASLPGIEAVSPQGDKIARAEAAAPKIAEGCYLLPHDAPWALGFLAEVSNFPNCKDKDRVDTAGQAIRVCLQTPRGTGFGRVA